MKYILIIFSLLGLKLFGEDRSFDLDFKINYYNSFKQRKATNGDKYFSPLNQSVSPIIGLSAEINDKAELKFEFNPTATIGGNEHCKGLHFVNVASLSYSVNELFSFDAGCLIQKRGGFENTDSGSLSKYDVTSLDLIYDFIPNAKFTPAFNLNIDFFGRLTLQLVKNTSNTLQKAPSLNLNWTMNLLGIEPLLQIGFYDENFKSIHYSFSLKADFDQLFFRTGYFLDTNREEKETKSISSWNVYTAYEYSDWVQPFFRIYGTTTKENDKINQRFTTYSLGNKIDIYDGVEPYLSFNLTRDIASGNMLDFRLGVYAEF